MKYLVLVLIAFGCSTPAEKFGVHGDEITPENAISMNQFLTQVNEEEKTFKVRGVIEEVCQMKGCWMTLKNEDGANVRITFKDYGFFVPKDISGSEVIIEGIANEEVLEEDVARHYAEDGGKEYDESMRNTITFVARGVLVKEG
ncbi:DUF4920 domain-containing protein [Ekhidna sp.]|uniref:DUF4920 domain-containing protein n=1 Tax=Ekhidna sp. TaxID=2608089 RepID=UPI003296E03C